MTRDERIAWWIFAATVPAAIAGALGESTIENHLGQPWQIAIFLSVFGVLLWIADRSPQERTIEQLGLLDGVLDRHLADPRADARRLALGDHDHDGPLHAPRA